MTELLVVDLNEHIQPMLTRAEFRTLHDAGCRAVGVRVSIAYSEQGYMHADPTAMDYVAYARELGWLAFGYAYLNPREALKTDPYFDAHEQGEFYTQAARMLDLDGHFADIEESTIRPAHLPYFAAAMRKGLRSHRVDALGLYSSAEVMAKFPMPMGLWDQKWFAHYGEAPSGRPLVRDVKTLIAKGLNQTQTGGVKWPEHLRRAEDIIVVGGLPLEIPAWQTPPDRAQYRAARLWQFGKVEYSRPNGKKRGIDGNVFQGTQEELRLYLMGEAPSDD